MDKQPFLIEQSIRYLDEIGDVKKYLHPNFFRRRRVQHGDQQEVDAGNWVDQTRIDLVQKLATRTPEGLGCRAVLTTDAGVGKSCNLQQLQTEISKSYPNKIAIRIRLGDLTRRTKQSVGPNQFILEYLVSHIQREHRLFERQPINELTTWLNRMVKSGNCILLFDELDQVDSAGHAATTLHDLAFSGFWQRCPILVAGRPYALLNHWESMLGRSNNRWHYFQLDGFTAQQQKTYLIDSEGVDRYELLVDEVRNDLAEILEVPRVLSYLRNHLSISDLRSIKTPSDIYLKAVEHLIAKGLNTEQAASFGLSTGVVIQSKDDGFKIEPKQIERAMDMLAALAWEMLWLPAPDQQRDSRESTTTTDRRAPRVAKEIDPNFDGVDGKASMQALRQRAYERLRVFPYYGENFTAFEDDMTKLTSMNEALERAIIDSGLREQLLWRNRSLQEFLAAYALCRMCRGDEPDQSRLWRWLFLPHDPTTESFYWIWRFAAEMESDSIRPEAWTQAMTPIYRPGNGTIQDTKRSTELLYRTWGRMDELAPNVVDGFLDEFQSILDGKRGHDSAKHAQLLKDSFITIPAELPFRMGIPKEKQGLPPDQRSGIANALEELRADPDSFIREQVERAGYAPGKRGDGNRAWLTQKWRDVINEGIDAYEQWIYALDETPSADSIEPSLPAFSLNALPVLRGWYELFDPGHGHRGEWYTDTLSRIAPTVGHSVFYVSWYDAWAFCKFAHWDGLSCRLPHEDEWEKGAKGAKKLADCDWRYWWGDEDDESHRTCDLDFDKGVSSSPLLYLDRGNGEGHKNPLGLIDILGNQWEWTADEYRWEYSRSAKGTLHGTSRVCRGGGWGNSPSCVRASVRSGNHPANLTHDVGFRLARA